MCMARQQAENIFLSFQSFKSCYLPISCNESHQSKSHGVQTSQHLHSSNPLPLTSARVFVTSLALNNTNILVTWKVSVKDPRKNKSKGNSA